MAQTLEDWSSNQRQTTAGAVESTQRARLDDPVVDASEAGARRLGTLYWETVDRADRPLRPGPQPGRPARAAGARARAVLLTFDEPELRVGPGRVECRYSIRGGLLARLPAGAITLAQYENGGIEVSSVITGFFPLLGARPGRPGWTGALYAHVQSRIHVAVSRRYFRRLLVESRHETVTGR